MELCEECLCVGWIDSKPAKVDERRTALLCTRMPVRAVGSTRSRRRSSNSAAPPCSARPQPGSGWSKVNKDRLERLLAEGLVLPAGLAASIDAAKADGSWSKLDHVDALAVPTDDLAAGSSTSTRPPEPKKKTSTRSHRRGVTCRGILEWIQAEEGKPTGRSASTRPPASPPTTSAPTSSGRGGSARRPQALTRHTDERSSPYRGLSLLEP